MINPSLGSLICHYRQLLDLSRRQLAQKAGLSIPLIQKLEHGATSNPRLSTLRQLAKALEVATVDLLPEHSSAAVSGMSWPTPTSEGAGAQQLVGI